MNPYRAHRALDWLKQAENDLLWAEETYKAEQYDQICFISQQVAEKCLMGTSKNHIFR
jgi:HEPN domain-containing protein